MDIKYYDRLLNVVGGGEVIEYIELLERENKALAKKAKAEAQKKARPFEDVVKFMETSLDRQIKVEELAKIACMQTTYFIKKFKA